MTWLLLLAFAGVVLGILGITVEGYDYLLFIGIAVLVVDLILFGVRLGGRRGRRPHR